LESSVSTIPSPLLAKPSVHIIIFDPLFPFFANPREKSRPGPRAVHPFVFIYFKD